MVRREVSHFDALGGSEGCAWRAMGLGGASGRAANRLRLLLKVLKGEPVDWDTARLEEFFPNLEISAARRPVFFREPDEVIASDESLPSSIRFEFMTDEERAFHWQRAVDATWATWSVVRKIRPSGVFDRDDLHQEAMISMVYSSVRFVEGRSKYSTFATFGIRQAAARYAFNQRFPVLLPTHFSSILFAYERWCAETNMEASTEERALAYSKQSGVAFRKVLKAAKFSELRFLSRPSRELTPPEELGATSSDWIAEPQESVEPAHDPTAEFEEYFDRQTLRRTLESELANLDDRARDILQARFGFGQYTRSHTLEEISTWYNVTRERIRQIEAKAMERLMKRPGLRRLAFELGVWG